MTSNLQPLMHLHNCTHSVQHEYGPSAIAPVYEQFLGIRNGSIQQLPARRLRHAANAIQQQPNAAPALFTWIRSHRVLNRQQHHRLRPPGLNPRSRSAIRPRIHEISRDPGPATILFQPQHQTASASSATSLGGATAISALANNTLFAVGANHDGTVGTMYGDALRLGTSAPVLLMKATGHTQTQDASWYTVWQRLRGWGVQLEIDPSSHYMYSDWPLMTEVLGVSLPGLLGEYLVDGGEGV